MIKINLILNNISYSLEYRQVNNNRIYCSCVINNLFENLSQLKFKRDYYLANIFMSTWIDQTLFWVLKDKWNPNCLNEKEVYDKFQEIFNIPKFYNHPLATLLPPVNILTYKGKVNLLNKKELLFYVKQLWWEDNVKPYFLTLGRNDIVESSILEFRNDLNMEKRFSITENKKLRFLWYD